jgi:hypothetical protein
MTVHAFQLKSDSEAQWKRFWDAYPVKHAKKDARKAWAQLNPSPALVQTICDHLALRVKCRQWREGFIPLPATFLRGERWEDELTQEDFYQAKL